MNHVIIFISDIYLRKKLCVKFPLCPAVSGGNIGNYTYLCPGVADEGEDRQRIPVGHGSILPCNPYGKWLYYLS